MNIVTSAIAHRDKATAGNNPYDSIWVVFDKDDFPSERYNSAVFLAQRENIHCACSNEAFELWYLLHFEFYNTSITRADYIKKLKKHLKGGYEKNSTSMYKKLKEHGSQKNAIKWAKTLDSHHDGSNPARENPSTKVYQLIESLNRFL